MYDVQGQYKGGTRTVQGQYKDSTRVEQGQYKGGSLHACLQTLHVHLGILKLEFRNLGFYF